MNEIEVYKTKLDSLRSNKPEIILGLGFLLIIGAIVSITMLLFIAGMILLIFGYRMKKDQDKARAKIENKIRDLEQMHKKGVRLLL